MLSIFFIMISMDRFGQTGCEAQSWSQTTISNKSYSNDKLPVTDL